MNKTLPFFVFDKNNQTAYFILLEPKIYKDEVGQYGKGPSIQESTTRSAPRYAMGT